MSSSKKIPRLSGPENHYEEKMDSIMSTLCEQKEMMCHADEATLKLTFPLKSDEDLAVADMAIQNGSQLVYVNYTNPTKHLLSSFSKLSQKNIKALKGLIYPNGILKQFKDIISDELANGYHVDAVQGKKCLKNYPHFYNALLSSTEEDNAEDLIRKAVHLAKKRQSKRKLLKQAHNIL